MPASKIRNGRAYLHPFLRRVPAMLDLIPPRSQSLDYPIFGMDSHPKYVLKCLSFLDMLSAMA